MKKLIMTLLLTIAFSSNANAFGYYYTPIYTPDYSMYFLGLAAGSSNTMTYEEELEATKKFLNISEEEYAAMEEMEEDEYDF